MASNARDNHALERASASDFGSDRDSDGEFPGESQKSRDEDVLKDHDEVERLLTENASRGVAMSGSKSWSYRGHNTDERAHSTRARKRSKANRLTPNPIYKMEEGFKDSSANTSSDSLVPTSVQWQQQTKIRSSLKIVIAFTIIAAFFGSLLYGAHTLSSPPRSRLPSKQWNNGTHDFLATTILISLDGFRADFLQQGLTPSLSAFVKSGVSPQYMLPSFPSVTFPNHYTLVTGLYPESHGIVGNQFWDPAFEEEFYYTNTTISMQPKWWPAEPLWATAEKQGVKTAVHMWPGSEAHILGIEPTYLDKYNEFEKLPRKVDRVLQWLDLTLEDRPQLIAAYVPDVDRDGHAFGPNSTQIRATIAEADNMFTLLLQGLLQRNLTEIVNIVVVSDHGMATVSVNRMVQLDDLIDMSLVDHLDGWPLRGLRLKNPTRDVPILYKQLLQASKEAGTFDVYTLETMPERYHFTNNPRIAPLWVVPKTGWLVIEKEGFNIAAALDAGEEFHPRGVHGFDHEHPLMRAIFIARGPAFPHAGNSRIQEFQNIEVYNIVCDTLEIEPHANNGTLRLPFSPVGLHDESGILIDTPKDDPADVHEIDETPVDSNPENTTDEATKNPESVDQHQEQDQDQKVDHGQPEDKSKDSWWKYLHDQLDKAKTWAEELIDSIRNDKNKQNSDKEAVG